MWVKIFFSFSRPNHCLTNSTGIFLHQTRYLLCW